MTELVPAGDIERIVGVPRHPTEHHARAVSAAGNVFILHSAECRDSGRDLRSCPFSIALDRGIDLADWRPGFEDVPMVVGLSDTGFLIPVTVADPGPVDPAKQRLTEAADGQELLVCTRVWEAWAHGTMSADDFQTVADDEEMMQELVASVFTLTPEQWQAEREKAARAIYESRGYATPFASAADRDTEVWYREADAALTALGFRRADQAVTG